MEDESEDNICNGCGEPILEGEIHDCISLMEEKETNHTVTVTKHEDIASYHKKCSPLKFDEQDEAIPSEVD